MWWNTKTQIVTKLENSNFDENQKLKMWWNSKTQIVMKIYNSNCDDIQKLKLWWNSNLNGDKTQNSKAQIVRKKSKTKSETKLKLGEETKN